MAQLLLCLPHGQHYTTGIQDTTSTHASVPYVHLSHMRYSFSYPFSWLWNALTEVLGIYTALGGVVCPSF